MSSSTIKNFFGKLFNSAIVVGATTQSDVREIPSTINLPDLTRKTTSTQPTISIVNETSVVSDAQVKDAIAAIQIQLDRDFSPAWGMSATLKFLAKDAKLPVNNWLVTLSDTSDMPGALGYHDITEDGMPLAKIFAKDDLKYGLSWTVTLSHEILEIVLDPWISVCSFAQDSNTTGIMYAYEVADPVEADSLGYEINGVLVSDFVFPAWFEGFRHPGSTKFDYMNVLTRPFQLAPGGYISQFVISPETQGWTQLNADKMPTGRQLKSGPQSRRAMRNRSRKDPDLVLNNTMFGKHEF